MQKNSLSLDQNLMTRRPLTTTHPHGYVFSNKDHSLGLISISKNASSSIKNRFQLNYLEPFSSFSGNTISFLRDPYLRFMSSIPETLLRITDPGQAYPNHLDQVLVSEDIHSEICAIAKLPINDFISSYIDILSYSFFDAHHEPQFSFLADRFGRLRIDSYVYRVSAFEKAIAQIEARFGVRALASNLPANRSGEKPVAGRNAASHLFRVLTRTGVMETVYWGNPLIVRYNDSKHSKPIRRRDVNRFCNLFASEIKNQVLPNSFIQRVEDLYARDFALWRRLEAIGGDVPMSEIWF
jgi:hypothetical protein